LAVGLSGLSRVRVRRGGIPRQNGFDGFLTVI